jgi:branched-subunit amino acid transport protein
MLTIWLCIAATAVLSAAIKGAGPAFLGNRQLRERAGRIIALLAPALLAALVVTDLLGPRWTNVDLSGIAGVGVAAAARLLKAPILVAIVLGVASTALLRTVA